VMAAPAWPDATDRIVQTMADRIAVTIWSPQL